MTLDFGVTTNVCNKKTWPQTQERRPELVIACGSCRRVWREHAEVAGAGLEVLHGVEYLEAVLRAGQLKITQPIRKKVTYHDFLPFGARLWHIRSAAQHFARHFRSRGPGDETESTVGMVLRWRGRRS